jgi:hypothetical protein
VLLGNGLLLNRLPLRHTGGGLVPGTRQVWGGNGSNNNIFAGWSAMPLAAMPNGYTHPATWSLALKTNAISSYTGIVGGASLSAVGAMGVAAVAALAGSASLAGTAQLVVSASATLAGVGDLSGALVAVQSAAATLAGSSAMPDNTLLAVGWAGASLAGVGSLAVPAYARGLMGATIEQAPAVPGGLTAEQQAQLAEVWQRLGLDPAAPLATGTAQVTFGGVTLNITESGGTVTLSRVA